MKVQGDTREGEHMYSFPDSVISRPPQGGKVVELEGGQRKLEGGRLEANRKSATDDQLPPK